MASGMRLLTVLLAVSLTIQGYSMQFGLMDALSVPIYEAELYFNSFVDFLDVEFKQKATLSFNINLILVFDGSDLERRGFAIILAGGIGHNFTILRLQYTQPAKVTVLIYGLPTLGLNTN